MVVPAAGQVESAWRTLAALAIAQDSRLADEWREMREGIGARSADFENGYALGLETARIVLRSSVALAKTQIDLDMVL